MVKKIAVIGAGGFVGARFMLRVRRRADLQCVGIVRSAKSLAPLSNVAVEMRIVDTSNVVELAESLRDCEIVLNSIHGDVSAIGLETQTVYNATRAAGTRQLIHLSSAVVFGRVESADINDDSLPDTRNWNLYARGKAEAEQFLRTVMTTAGPRIIVLRPGLIWGPGSTWARSVGEQLSRGEAALINNGLGIANLVYVDNLIESVLAICDRPSGPPGFYNVGDPHTVTWKDYYRGMARRLGYAPDDVKIWPGRRLFLTQRVALEWCLQRKVAYRLARWSLPRLPAGLKAWARGVLQGSAKPPAGRAVVRQSPPRLCREHWALQTTRFRLPTDKIARDYGPFRMLAFEEALQAMAAWLDYAGYGAAAQTVGNKEITQD